jgi:DedD protein
MADKEAQTELKKRARRRLVGAIALATAAAIVLPMVMEQEPKPVSQDIQIRIPSQDSGTVTSRILPAKPAAPAAGESKPPSQPGGAMAAAGPTSEAPNQDSGDKSAPATKEPGQGAGASSAAAPAPAAGEKTPDKAVEKSPAKSAEKAIEKAVPKPEPKTAEKPAKGEDKAEAKGEKSRAQTILEGGDQYVVQLAVLADAANAIKLRERAKAEGYSSYTESLQTQEGTRTRVRVGPFPSRDSAEKARDKLKHLAPNGIVVPKS